MSEWSSRANSLTPNSADVFEAFAKESIFNKTVFVWNFIGL
jgi:hypothetical protein